MRGKEPLANISRTLGINVEQFNYKDLELTAFDIGGQDTFRPIWKTYIGSADAVCYVIDSSDPSTYGQSYQALKEVLEVVPPKGVLMLLANKSDISQTDALELILEAFDLIELQKVADLRAINIFFVSALTGDQLYDAFDWLFEALTGRNPEPTKITLNHVWVYERDSGINVAQVNFAQNTAGNDDLLLVPFFNALNQFARQLDPGSLGISQLLLSRSSDSSVRLVKLDQKDLTIVLAVDEYDAIPQVVEVAKELLQRVRENLPVFSAKKMIKANDIISWTKAIKIVGFPH